MASAQCPLTLSLSLSLSTYLPTYRPSLLTASLDCMQSPYRGPMLPCSWVGAPRKNSLIISFLLHQQYPHILFALFVWFVTNGRTFFILWSATSDDLAHLANTPSKVESQLHNLEQAIRIIGLFVTADETEFIRLKQHGAIFTLNDKPLKLVDQFTYLSSNISSTESDVNIRIGKA